MYLNMIDCAQGKPHLAQRGCRERGYASASVPCIDPIADLEPAWPDPAHQAGAAHDPGFPGPNRVLKSLATFPAGLAVREKLCDRSASMICRPRHPWAQVIEIRRDGSEQRLELAATPTLESYVAQAHHHRWPVGLDCRCLHGRHTIAGPRLPARPSLTVAHCLAVHGRHKGASKPLSTGKQQRRRAAGVRGARGATAIEELVNESVWLDPRASGWRRCPAGR